MGNNHPKWLSFFQRGWNHQPETIEMDDNWGYTLMDWTPVWIINENMFAGDYLWIASQSELDMNADILKMHSVWFNRMLSVLPRTQFWRSLIMLSSSQGTQTWQWKIHNFLMIVPWTFIYNHLYKVVSPR